MIRSNVSLARVRAWGGSYAFAVPPWAVTESRNYIRDINPATGVITFRPKDAYQPPKSIKTTSSLDTEDLLCLSVWRAMSSCRPVISKEIYSIYKDICVSIGCRHLTYNGVIAALAMCCVRGVMTRVSPQNARNGKPLYIYSLADGVINRLQSDPMYKPYLRGNQHV